MEWIMNWWWATILGPIVLGAVIAYALMTERRLTLAERAAQKEAVKRLYGHEPEHGGGSVDDGERRSRTGSVAGCAEGFSDKLRSTDTPGRRG
jgi:hypothetical protein